MGKLSSKSRRLLEVILIQPHNVNWLLVSCMYLHLLSRLGEFLRFGLRVGVESAVVLICSVGIFAFALVSRLKGVGFIEGGFLVLCCSLHSVFTLQAHTHMQGLYT